MNPRIGFLIGCVSIALTSPAASAAGVGPRSELCNKLQKSVAEVTGKDARQLEDHPRLLQECEACPRLGLEYPVRVGLVVDEVPEASQLRLGQELLESASGSVE